MTNAPSGNVNKKKTRRATQRHVSTPIAYPNRMCRQVQQAKQYPNKQVEASIALYETCKDQTKWCISLSYFLLFFGVISAIAKHVRRVQLLCVGRVACQAQNKQISRECNYPTHTVCREQLFYFFSASIPCKYAQEQLQQRVTCTGYCAVGLGPRGGNVLNCLNQHSHANDE